MASVMCRACNLQMHLAHVAKFQSDLQNVLFCKVTFATVMTTCLPMGCLIVEMENGPAKERLEGPYLLHLKMIALG